MQAKTEPMEHIKEEPGLTPHGMPNVPYPNVAAARAQEQLQKNYGQRAASSISAIQAGIGGQDSRPGLPHGHPAGPGSYRPPTAPSGHGNIPQTDGAGDFEGIMMERDADGNLVEMGRVEIDGMLHRRIMENAKAMEGGGLMLPLKEATKHSSAPRHAKQNSSPGQVDGGDDDIDDEDAINSDLDDPNDEHENSEDEDEQGLSHIMLCMYDKVQRVKNKW
jgi:transcription initiation factor TFIIA large subunit